MPTRVESDAVIVGAGPAGSTLAALLARDGWRVVLLDATEFPRQKICGEHLSATTLPLLDRLGVRETIEREAIPVRSHAIVLPGGRRLSVRFAPHGAPAIAISRYRLDQLLVERAANAGAIVIESHRVREVIVEHGAVCGVIAHRTGLRSQSKTFRAHLTIAADGRRSIVARRVGNSMRYGRALIGFNRHFRSDGQLLHAVTVPGALTMFSLPGGYIGASIVEDGSLNLCGVVPAKLVRSGGRSIHDTLYGWARSHRELQSVLEHDEPGGWLTMADVSTQWSTPAKPGVLFIGDALATIDPLMGEGMNMALSGAWQAYETLVGVRRQGDVTSAVQQAYARAWRNSFAGRVRRGRIAAALLSRPRLLSAMAQVDRLRANLSDAVFDSCYRLLLGDGQATTPICRSSSGTSRGPW